MVKIKSIRKSDTIKQDPNNMGLKSDGTVINPVKASFVTVEFEDGIIIQVEKLQNEVKADIINKIKIEYKKILKSQSVDGISDGDDIII
tara:strand:+ start:274 stop:540 length:267 start_codon:yes stop_codon:yes gene_type:complete